MTCCAGLDTAWPMARVTVEDCIANIGNMYELVHVATRRTRQLFKGSDPLVKSKNRVIVTALREIAAGRVKSSFQAQDSSQLTSDDIALLTN